MRKGIVITWLTGLFIAIIALFWHNDWVYNLPTPVPENYKPVYTGEGIRLAQSLNRDNRKPRFLHFFNPA